MANTNLINDIVLPDSMVTFRNNSVITNALDGVRFPFPNEADQVRS